MIIKLDTISNPGISFTEDVNQKLISLYLFAEQNKKREITYAELQTELIDNGIFSGSYIRSFIPFMRNFGVINDYSKIIYDEFFTKIGKMYIESIINYYNIKEIKDEKMEKLQKQNIADILCLFLDYLCKNKNKYFEKYLDILYFVKKYNKICKNEFYIYEYCKVNKIDCDELIKKYRDNSETIEIKFFDENNNEIENNAFNYFIALLSDEQCNYVCRSNQNYYEINREREDLINSILNQYL